MKLCLDKITVMNSVPCNLYCKFFYMNAYCMRLYCAALWNVHFSFTLDHVIFIHSALCLRTGPYPFPKPVPPHSVIYCFLCRFRAPSRNRLMPNDPYMDRTAPLTSKRCILYIYSTNIGTEYFKHALYSPFFFLFKMQFVS